MKKVYLFLAVLGMSVSALAQNLNIQIFDYSGNDITNGIHAITGVHAGDDTDVRFILKNNTGAPINVKVKRQNLTMPTNYTNSMCFATFCFNSDLDETPQFQTLEPSVMDSSFHGIFFANGETTVGDMCITYKIFNADDESQYVTVRAYYGSCLTASVAENNLEALSISAFPNPASGSVLIKHNLSTDGQLMISDITGKTLKNIRLVAGSQSAQVDISDLKAGIYIYSIQTGSKRVISKKLVVR